MTVHETSDTKALWAGTFGDEYTDRNRVDWEKRMPFWQHIVDLTGARSFLDVGCNAGWNMRALRKIDPDYEMSGIDINRRALEQALRDGLDVHELPADELVKEFGTGAAELVVTSGVLIHVPPDDLPRTMAAILDVSQRWVLAIEYQAPETKEVEYRGSLGRLWKADFGQLYMDRGLSLVETGVADGFDRCHYWLLEKS